jgi:hypothetical protein
MKDVLEAAGIKVSPENKKDVDRIIHEMVNVAYKDCSPTWKAVKERIKKDPEARKHFIQELQQRIQVL